MNPEDFDLPPDELAARMADYDERLATGASNAVPEPAAPPDERARWQRLQACMRLLRGSRPEGTPVPLNQEAADEAALLERLLHPEGSPVYFGRFRIRRELGRGGFGIVLLADDPHLQRPVAVKVPRPDTLASADLRQRFLREARAAASLNHPNVVPVYEAGEVGPICYIVSAFCPDDNLAVWLRHQKGPLPAHAAAALVAMLANAVEHAHRKGILHRDLKPSNILLEPRADAPADELPFLPRLTDFGLAKLLEADSELTTSGAVLGTLAYMAPEQAEGWAEAVGAPTDVNSLGAILYELLTRRVPCQGPSLAVTLEQVRSGQPVPVGRLNPACPRDLETNCLKCLQKEPEQRYATAAALEEDLQRFLRQEPILGQLPSRWRRGWRWCRRPERISNAAVMAAFNGLVETIVSLFGLLLLLTGGFAVDSMGPALAYLLVTSCLGIALLGSSWKTSPRHPRALWLGIFLPMVLPLFLLVSLLRRIEYGGLITYEHISPTLAQSLTIFVFHALTILAYLLAQVAYQANRQRPGFASTSAEPLPPR